jgi:nicotinate phosphoribosyltransferase
MQSVKSDRPVLSSMTWGQDWYVYTMGFLIYLLHRDVSVRFAFKNRTRSVLLGRRLDVDRVRAELDHVRTVGHTDAEIDFILRELYRARGTSPGSDPLLDESGYGAFLRSLRLPEYCLETELDGNLRLEFYGPWSSGLFWEIPALCIINQLQNEAAMRADGVSSFDVEREGMKRLGAKIAALTAHRECAITDFGTRRRFSADWQRRVNCQLVERLPPTQFQGTSCPAIAMELGIPLIGTNAHQLPMVYSALYRGDGGAEAFAQSQLKVLRDWFECYGERLAVVLPDAYTTEYLLGILPSDLARAFRGVRQDSGDPLEVGDRIVRFYQESGIDPCTKLLIFSDGLTVDEMIRIAAHFQGRINTGFGWGTNLTNDLGPKPLSLVIKPVWAAGYPVVKLSDDPAKATGDASEIERVRAITGCATGPSRVCVY